MTKPYSIVNSQVIVNHGNIPNVLNKYFPSIATKLNLSDNNELGLHIRELPKYTDYLNKFVRSSIYMEIVRMLKFKP